MKMFIFIASILAIALTVLTVQLNATYCYETPRGVVRVINPIDGWTEVNCSVEWMHEQK